MHANARLTVHGRLLLCERVAAGRAVAHVAREMGVSRATAHKWVRRFREEGVAGLADRSSRPWGSPRRTAPEVEACVVGLRRSRRLGPARIGGILGMHPSTVHRVLRRAGEPHLAWLDRPTGAVIRRYERDRAGELVHVDVKKMGRLRDGGGWRAHGRAGSAERRSKAGRKAGRLVGYEFVHVAIDDHSRFVVAEVLPDERADTAAAFWHRAVAEFAAHGVTVERALTDNGACYRSRQWREALAATNTIAKHTRPYRPQTNGKVERFNRTMVDECLYAANYHSGAEREAALRDWLHSYNHHRAHTALGGHPPISRVNNVPGHYS